MNVIDVHTHQLSERWVEQIKKHGGPHYAIRELKGQDVVHLDGAPFMTFTPPMFDWDRRVRDMNEAGVDLAIVSLTTPNVYWGGEEVSAETAVFMNDHMAAGQTAYPDRIRWFASLPWQYPQRALAELERALTAGAKGVYVSANVGGMSLTDPRFVPIWKQIDARALPVLVHPAAPPGVAQMDMMRYNLVASIGFMFDTSLAISRMIFDGFFDTYTKVKIIAAHAGGALPYLKGRLDICFDNMPPCREKIGIRPSEYLPRLYYDSVTFTEGSLGLCLDVAGEDRLLYGSDYPHNIGDMAGCLARVDGLPGAAARKARGKNAEHVFGL